MRRTRRLALTGLLLACAWPAAGQTGSVMPVPRQQFLDNNGNPCTGCKLYTYVTGTTTPLNTYSDVTLMTANAQPIVMNSAGRPSVSGTEITVFLSASSYKFELDSAADVPIWIADTVSATSAGLTGVSNTGDVVFQVDTNNDGTNVFSFVNGTGTQVAQISESGNAQFDGTLTVDGASTHGGVATFSGGTIGGWTTVTVTATGTQNDYAPGLVGHTILRCNNATLLTLNGFTSGAAGQRLRIVSVGAGQVDLAPQAGGSTDINRLLNPATAGATSLAAGSGYAEYVYDATTLRWRLVAHEQGAWITPTFAAGNYTASSGNWTVGSGDVLANRYRLSGRTLTWQFYLQTTTVSATPASLNAAIPGGFTTAGTSYGSHNKSDNNGTYAMATWDTSAAGVSIVRFFVGVNYGSGTWAAATDTTALQTTLTLDVQ